MSQSSIDQKQVFYVIELSLQFLKRKLAAFWLNHYCICDYNNESRYYCIRSKWYKLNLADTAWYSKLIFLLAQNYVKAKTKLENCKQTLDHLHETHLNDYSRIICTPEYHWSKLYPGC